MRLWLLLAAAAAFPAAALAQADSRLSRLDTSKPAAAFPLDPMLAEVSGLTPAGPHSVFAHNDEYAIIHEVDVDNGVIIRSFALGKPTIAGDFEGVAVRGEFIYLVTSDGKIYEAPIKKHRERARFVVYDTGLKESCEIEGMTIDPTDGAFLLLCKHSVLDKKNKRITIYRWRMDDRWVDLKPWLQVPLADIIPAGGKRENFKASELQRDPKTGDLFILDANRGALVEITSQGVGVGYKALAPKAHSQAEGLALMPDGSIVVGDEGRGAFGKLTVYRPQK